MERLSFTGAIVTLTEHLLNDTIGLESAVELLTIKKELENISDTEVLQAFIDALQECKNGLNTNSVRLCAIIMTNF